MAREYTILCMRKTFIVTLALLVVAGCKKETATPPAPAATQTAAKQAQPPIPMNGIAIWLVGDDAKPGADGKLASWSNPAIPGAGATADKPEQQPAVVTGALNGHAVVRFDGGQNILVTSADISPAATPDATIFAVFSSKVTAKSPYRKLYGDDNGGFDRAVGLDDRGGADNYTVFTGSGAKGYFMLSADTPYVTADEFTKDSFSGWVDGRATLQKVAAVWGPKPGDALPNLYIGGTGTAYHEPWQGDVAEFIVYNRVLSDQERTQVEDYLGKKYGVAIAH